MRDTARGIFRFALAKATIASAFERHVHLERGVLRVCEDLYDVGSASRVFVVSIGKAAHTMAEALQSLWGGDLQGIVAGSILPEQQVRGFRYFVGGHPTPNTESLAAGDAVLRALDALDSQALVLFLLSGGGSSIIEKPVDDDISLADLIATYKTLVLCGAPIAAINAVRKHLSLVKGGRLAVAASPAQQVSLLVSDVPDSTPDALASGPTMPDSTSINDCYGVVEKYGLLPHFPASVRELFERHALDETPKSDDPAFVRSRWWPILSNASAVEAAGAAAAQNGFAVEVDNSCDDWEYEPAADHLLKRVRELRAKVSRVCLISGGEVTVKVTNGGTGGRNQQFALACAQRIAGEDITVLSGGTDGVDGNSTAAGAVVDGTTVARAEASGFDVAQHAAHFNAFPLFEKLGDAIVTGPTGNNLRDLRILLA